MPGATFGIAAWAVFVALAGAILAVGFAALEVATADVLAAGGTAFVVPLALAAGALTLAEPLTAVPGLPFAPQAARSGAPAAVSAAAPTRRKTRRREGE